MNAKLSVALPILCLILAMPAFSWACTVPPPYLYVSHHDLVLTSEAIVLAKAVEVRTNTQSEYATFAFETVEVLKGSPPDTFELYGLKAGRYAESNYGVDGGDFEGHRSPSFWAWNLGNSAMNTACSTHGVFATGQRYLIFMRDKPHFRAYENIREENDLWLDVIRLVAKSSGNGTLADFPLPKADSAVQCIEKVVGDRKYSRVRHTAIDACISRHDLE